LSGPHHLWICGHGLAKFAALDGNPSDQL